MSKAPTKAPTITFELDGQQVEANVGESIWQVAKRLSSKAC